MRRIKNIVTKNWILIIILLLGVFLRFYRLPDFAMFLSDQGRDAIIIKRIVTGEHFPAIGAPTSVGQVYLGPFYYYFIAPWLLLFNFQPIGLAFGVAFFSSLFILINFLTVKRLVNEKTAYISTIFLTLSATLIDFSRFSWNPNLLPLFSFLTAYSAIQSVKTKKWHYFVLTGAFLSFSIQLHYLALFLGLPVAIVFLLDFYFSVIDKSIKKIGKRPLSSLLNIFASFASFVIFTSPLIIFEFRHNFLNSRNFVALFKSTPNLAGGRLNNLFETFIALNKYSLNITLNQWQTIFLVVFVLLSSLIIILKTKGAIRIFITFFIFCFLGISAYSGSKFPHYLGIIYPFYFLTIAYFLSEISNDNFGKVVTFVFVVLFATLNFQKYSFFYQPKVDQIGQAKTVANFLAEKINHQPFNIATWPVEFTEDSYLYFLELKGLRPADRQKVQVTKQMFVLCNKEPCQVINSPSWNISMFGKAKVVGQWQVADVKIFKLAHL